MDRPGHATTPTAPELRRPRVLNYLLGSVTASPFGLFSSYLLPAHSFGWRSLWANECGLEKRSSTCRAQFSALKLCHGPPVRLFFLSFCCRRTPLVGARCGQTSAGPPVRPLFFLAAAGALLWFLSFSFLPARSFGWCSLWTNECGLEKRGKRSFCGWPLPLDR